MLLQSKDPNTCMTMSAITPTPSVLQPGHVHMDDSWQLSTAVFAAYVV